jgi:uncharacterized membrane protein
MESGRLEAFSDGVFAVAITLLALDLAVPGPGGLMSLAEKLFDHRYSFAAFVVSFLTIGIIWVNHHTLLKNFARIDRPLLFINLLLLFFVVCIPFATSTIAAYLPHGRFDASVAAAIYEGVFEGMSLSFCIMFWWAIRREHLKIALTREAARTATIRFGIGNIAYIAAIGVAFISPTAAFEISAVVAVYYMFEQTPGRGSVSAAQGDSGTAGYPPDTG